MPYAAAVTTARVLCPRSLRIIQRHLPRRPPVGHLRIRVKYAGLNRPDLLQLEGRYSPPPGVTDVPGLELSGIVIGHNDCSSEAQQLVGREVMALVPGGAFAEVVDVPEESCLPVPQNVSLQQAAGLLESYLTAFLVLQLSGSINDASLLVHAAASGVGSALLQMARRHRAAEVIAVIGRDSKKPFVSSLGATKAINRGECSDYMRLVSDDSIDVVWDCVGSPLAAEHLRVCRQDAAWVLYGTLGGTRALIPFNLAHLLIKRVQLRTTTLRSRSHAYKRRLLANFAENVLPEFREGQYKVHVHGVFSWAGARLAVDEIRQNANCGKIILEID